MKCPCCKIPMIVVERHRIELDYCMKCKGIWFDAGELALISQGLEIDLDLPDIMSLPLMDTDEQSRLCPRCNKEMDKTNLGIDDDVVIDRCKRGHGLWFDQGEFGNVVTQRKITEQEVEEMKIIKFLGETFQY